MHKKVCIALIALFLVLYSSVAQAGTFGWYPQSGDAIYRDMDLWAAKSLGHAGMYVGGGNNDVIHMQKSGCEKTSFYNFYCGKKYWGAMYAGDSWAAKKRISVAERILKNRANYDFYLYKYPYDLYYRCDGLAEKCFEESGKDIINDYHWSSLSPQMQWKSFRNMSYRVITADGEAAFKEPTVPVTGWILF